ncbi:hypothetical protein BH11BAC5_BH11BAC5_48860 [soil metagenome]
MPQPPSYQPMNAKKSFLPIALLFQIVLISCNYNKSGKESFPVQKIASNLPNVPGKVKNGIDTIPVNTAMQITGTWEDLGKETLTVDITKNTITYREHQESHKFKIKADSIYIYYPDMTLTGKCYLIADTLVISMEDGYAKYLRLKK